MALKTNIEYDTFSDIKKTYTSKEIEKSISKGQY